MKKHETNKEKHGIFKFFLNGIIVLIFLVAVIYVLYIAGSNYIRNEIKGKTNFIINNENVTTSLKSDVLIENGIVYISKADIANFFDNSITYDEKYDHIITCSEEAIASLPIGKQDIEISSSKVRINGGVLEKNSTYYIPLSELGNVYNIKTTYMENTNIVTVDSLDRAYSIATVSKNTSIKYKPTTLSRTVTKVKQGETVVIANRSDYVTKDGWTRIRTENGTLGYIKTNKLGQENKLRDTMERQNKIEGKISLVWDFYSKYVSAPNRTNTNISGVNVVSPSFFYLSEDGSVNTNIGSEGQNYITWAKNKNYQIWPMVANDSLTIDETSNILRDYKQREKVINQIVNYVVQYKLDGINIDFEHMYEKDKNYFSRFLIELEPRLNEIGAVLSVDVTAPDGAPEWSMCYDRYTIGKVADYIVFMAYDQYGDSAIEAGTNAGYNWVEANIKKFLGQEGVLPEKIVLGIPFYARLWEEQNGSLNKWAYDMAAIDSVLPQGVQKQWDEDLKQYYIEYMQDGATYKMWIEDEKSIDEKLNLVEKYKLGGAAYWELGREPSSIWNLISQKLEIK